MVSIYFVFLAVAALLSVDASEFTAVKKDAISVASSDPQYKIKPGVDGAKVFYGGKIKNYSGKVIDVTSPIVDKSTGNDIYGDSFGKDIILKNHKTA